MAARIIDAVLVTYAAFTQYHLKWTGNRCDSARFAENLPQ